MASLSIESAMNTLQERYSLLNWSLHNIADGQEKMYKWPGDPKEDIIICVHKSSKDPEVFHRHDFFYFNFTYKGKYESLSYKYDNSITIGEGELYAGQPFSGHALKTHSNQDTIIIGTLIQKEVFFRSFLPMLSANSKLFHFFLDPTTKSFADEYIHFKIEDDFSIRTLLELMVVEYANKAENTQDVLKPLCLSFLMQVVRQYEATQHDQTSNKTADQIVKYISEHCESVTLKNISERFGYHPNYISNFLTREIGKSFSQILFEQRMKRAIMLIKGSTLPLEEIAFMIGYSNSSNFYKAFKSYYKQSPRKYLKTIIDDQDTSAKIEH